jgi:hypothetical protein
MSRLPAALILAGTPAGIVAAQQPAHRDQPGVRFRLEINYVEVDAAVTDGSSS